MSVPMITEMHYVKLTGSKFNLLESMYLRMPNHIPAQLHEKQEPLENIWGTWSPLDVFIYIAKPLGFSLSNQTTKECKHL